MTERIGIILTAGVQEKTRGGYRVEPDLEGKIRSLLALQDLKLGAVDRLIVTGGQPVFGKGVAEHYASYLNRKLSAINLDLPQVQAVTDVIETESDLKAVSEFIKKDDRVIIYSSAYHLRRKAASTLNRLGFLTAKDPSERRLKEKDRRYERIINGVLNPRFVLYQNIRGIIIDLLPYFFIERLAQKQRQK